MSTENNNISQAARDAWKEIKSLPDSCQNQAPSVIQRHFDAATAELREHCKDADRLRGEVLNKDREIAELKQRVAALDHWEKLTADEWEAETAQLRAQLAKAQEALREDIISARIIEAEVKQAGVNRHGIKRDIGYIIDRCTKVLAAIDAARKGGGK